MTPFICLLLWGRPSPGLSLLFGWTFPIDRICLPLSSQLIHIASPVERCIFCSGKTKCITINQQTNEVIPWPKIKLRTTLTTRAKDTLIPAREILNARIKTRTWDAIWGLMSLADRKDGALWLELLLHWLRWVTSSTDVSLAGHQKPHARSKGKINGRASKKLAKY